MKVTIFLKIGQTFFFYRKRLITKITYLHFELQRLPTKSSGTFFLVLRFDEAMFDLVIETWKSSSLVYDL